jgi:hypothetical protein
MTTNTARNGPLRILLGTLAVGMVAGALAFLIAAHVVHSDWFSKLTGGRPTTIDSGSTAVLQRIQQLNRLETVEYSLDKIVEGEKQSAYLPDFLVGEKLLLVAHGDVIAGVDLSQLKLGDVSVHGDTVHVHLPAAQVLSTRIDNQQTRVYSRETGLLVNADLNLESQVRASAEQQIGQAALDDGILIKATQNARTSITSLLYGLGFHTVEVESSEPHPAIDVKNPAG